MVFNDPHLREKYSLAKMQATKKTIYIYIIFYFNFSLPDNGLLHLLKALEWKYNNIINLKT